METMTEPASELQALEKFMGSWEIKGRNLDAAPVAPNTAINGNVFFQYMPGHFFVTSNWNRKYRFKSHIGMSVIGFDRKKNRYFMEKFDNLGNRREYDLTHDEDSWHISGDTERAEIRFDDDHTYSERWEVKKSGHWKPVCEMKVMKI